MAASFAEKAARYRALHAGDVFVAGGCWDAGTARLLAHARLPCLETSSAGVMFARGLPDGDGLATQEIMLENARSVAAAVDLPVTADLRMAGPRHRRVWRRRCGLPARQASLVAQLRKQPATAPIRFILWKSRWSDCRPPWKPLAPYRSPSR